VSGTKVELGPIRTGRPGDCEPDWVDWVIAADGRDLLAGEEEEWLHLTGSAWLTHASAAKQPHQKRPVPRLRWATPGATRSPSPETAIDHDRGHKMLATMRLWTERTPIFMITGSETLRARNSSGGR
jgi:hypothetical protein